MVRRPTNPLPALLRERSSVAARLVQARQISDELSPHRNRMWQHKLEALNARINAFRSQG